MRYRRRRRKGFFRNIRPAVLILVIPTAVGVLVGVLLLSGIYISEAADLRSKRLVTPGYEYVSQSMVAKQPTYERKFAYYEVREGQSMQQIADFFGVDVGKLTDLNPGSVVPGTTLRIPPLEKPLTPKTVTRTINQAVITDDRGLLRVTNEYNNRNQEIVTDIPELASLLAPYNAISKVSDKVYRMLRPISLDGNIRLELTSDTVERLELESNNSVVACLCGDQSIFNIRNIKITTIDSATGKPDTDVRNGRGFVRMKNGRMDIVRSDISYLGNGLRKTLTPQAGEARAQQEGGVYGVSWRIADDKLGKEIATGWVEDTKFTKNHFGAFTYGASGMLWRGNLFADNDVYGLDPHDDSNNALIENNVFRGNGTHGFIVSKRCNYNIIQNNTSYNNGLHGFMLHQDSAYNVMKDNVSFGNVDNFAIYASNYNTVKNNKSYAPKGSHVRINAGSKMTFITGNMFYGGPRGVYVYGNTEHVHVSKNNFVDTEKELQARASNYIVFEDNVVEKLFFDIASDSQVIFGDNAVESASVSIPTTPKLPQGYTLQ